VKRPSVDPSFTFALSLILSLLLCYPTFKHMLHGSVDVTEGGIRYLVALAISWCGVHGVAVMVAGYAGQPRRPSPPPRGTTSQPARRREDIDEGQQAA
jgi:hypothetical protein